MVAIGVAEMMLHVADDWVLPIGHIDRTVGSDVHGGGAEVSVAGTNQVLHPLAFEARAFLVDFDTIDALEADDVAVQKIALEFLREMPAGKNGVARAGPRGPVPERLHA